MLVNYYVVHSFGFFKPIIVGAVCRIPNQSPEAVPIELSLSGKGQLPAIHFSLPEEGSYVENKQGVKLTQENEIENVIEINPIGIGIKVLFNLWVLNPTQARFSHPSLLIG